LAERLTGTLLDRSPIRPGQDGAMPGSLAMLAKAFGLGLAELLEGV
jgi:hypothetical protein